LLLSVVGIVVTGLVVSDIVTYNALRSFLITRVDQQLQGAAYPVGRALLSSSGLGPKLPGAPPAAVPVPPARHSVFGDHAADGGRGGGIFAHGGPTSGPSGATSRGVLVPPGTYGQIRNVHGAVEGHLFFSYGGKAPAGPAVPTRLPGSGLPASSDYYFSTSGAGGVDYRAVAKPLVGGQGTVVIAVPLTDLNGTLRQLLLIELVVSAVLLAALGVLSWAMIRRDLRPLEEITDTAGTIAGGDLSSRVAPDLRGSEVAQLGRSFNAMLDQIERAFAQRAASEDRLRRFLADASHELRTPLTSILGYAELFDLGVRDRPEELASSMHHIRDEAVRMGGLVNDLFLLAQLDHERPLHREPLDLAELVRQSVDSLMVADPDRPVVVDADGPVWVVGDRSRLRQVVDNLVVNAQRHTPPGTGIEVRVGDERGRAALTVHDHGPGIDPSDADRIFEPFFRSDPSRARSSGGAGLGLAIVAAIVVAHGGTVRAEPGSGATFVVELPSTAPAPGATGPAAGAPTSPRLVDADLLVDGDSSPVRSTGTNGERAANGSSDGATAVPSTAAGTGVPPPDR
jgi:two-component system OmpR family sensor kinase